ncbi:HTH-type transcriptional activator RhaS [Paenibacillus solanacearum]|uniref:HTH-type transcriptional activator RhaS n=1 Tax=Paenibacillus solanacearum TaxID=2048548 RepID=A0A916K5Q3_9BACL|nr:AraC family transcriptional regulator [Paenibacillus solanacearum]CAG7643511.1 HTH-type transcriptional activator RhaS [Paenibacillus solanacearum]
MIDLNEAAGYFARSLLTVERVYHTILPANKRIHAHTSEHPTLKSGFVFVIRGNASFQFNDTKYDLKPGMVVHGGPDMTLQIRTGATELDYFLVHYASSEPAIDAEGARCMRDHFLLDAGENPRLWELLTQLREEYGTPGNIPLLRVKTLFYTILYELFVCCRNRLHQQNSTLIEEAVAYIHDHYMEPLSLQALAERFSMNSKAFAYLFGKYTGISPIDYLIRHRIKRASEMLALGSSPVKQIAASVGYSDPHYFSRIYKKHTGHSPSEIRTE